MNLINKKKRNTKGNNTVGYTCVFPVARWYQAHQTISAIFSSLSSSRKHGSYVALVYGRITPHIYV